MHAASRPLSPSLSHEGRGGKRKELMDDDRQTERLKWRSRRGLLELDLLFTRFWQQSASRLNETDMRALDRLLQLPDNDILDMVMARQACTDAQITPVIHCLQQL